MSLTTDIQAALTQYMTDSDLMHQVVHGGVGTTVTLGGNAVPSIAKAISDISAAIVGGYNDGWVAQCTNSIDRGTTTPSKIGQLLFEYSTKKIYYAYATPMGSWTEHPYGAATTAANAATAAVAALTVELANKLGINDLGKGAVDVQVFTTSGTWNKPAGTLRMIDVLLIGGGGGGGSGRRGAASTNRFGGGGGASGHVRRISLEPSSIGSTVAVTVGAGGTGASPTFVNTTNGSDGLVGGTSSFGTYFTAPGGNPGGAGTSAAGGPAGTSETKSGAFVAFDVLNAAGGIGGTSAAAAGETIATRIVPTGGGGGAGITSANAVSSAAGAGGGFGGFIGFTLAGGSGTDMTIGNHYGAQVPMHYVGTGGGGGLPGDTSGVAAGSSGGNGGNYGGGGGGGGGSTNGANSGGGGNGGPGIVVVRTYRA